MLRSIPTFLGASLLLTAPAPAQIPGLGSPIRQFGGTATSEPTTHVLDLTAATASQGHFDGFLGVTRDGQGNYWASSRRDLARLRNPHMLHKFDRFGRHLASFPQPPALNTGSTWGIRDMAFEPGISPRHIYGSSENSATGLRVLAFDVVAGRWDPQADFKVPAAIGTGTVRALAFDPLGNGGKGSIWTANFSSRIFEFELVRATSSATPKLLASYPSAQAWTFGLAYDRARRTMWAHGQDDSPRTVPRFRSLITEIHTSGSGGKPGTGTGVRAMGDRKLKGSVPGGTAGGMEIYVDSSGNPVFLLLAQASPDSLVTEYGRFRHGTSSGGSIGMNSQVPFAGNLGFGLTLEGSKAGTAFLFIGSTPASMPLMGEPFAEGTRLLVNPAVFFAARPVVSGRALVPAAIPADMSLVHAVVLFQFVELVGTRIATSDRGNLHVH